MKYEYKYTRLNSKQLQFLQALETLKYTYMLLYGGRRSSKTFIILYIMISRAMAVKSRQLVIREIFHDTKISIWLDSFTKVLSTAFGGNKNQNGITPPLSDLMYFNNSDLYCRFPNGSEIWFGGFGGTEKENRVEKILGREYSTIFFNECSQMNYKSVVMALGSLAENVGLKKYAFFDCNPPKTAHFSYKLFFEGVEPGTKNSIDTSKYFQMQMNPMDNVENIGQAYINDVLMKMPARYQKRFLLGEYDDNPQALWERAWIDRNRVSSAPDLDRIVVAVDPAASAGEHSAETGIIVAGRKGKDYNPDSRGYVLDDLTIKGSPAEWAGSAVSAYYKYKADCIVAEKNNGGDMVEFTIRTISDVPVRLVWASRGKIPRAEPVSSLYETDRIHHVGTFSELEDQMCDWELGDASPDRIDALVWGFTELFNSRFEESEITECEIGGLDELGSIL